MSIDTLVAIIAAIFGGAGVKILEKWLNKSQAAEDSGFKLREELRTELTRLREELDKTEKDLDEYRKRYYDLMEVFTQTKIDLENALNKIQQQTTQAQNTIGNT